MKQRTFLILAVISFALMANITQLAMGVPIDPKQTGRSPYVGPQDNTLKWIKPWAEIDLEISGLGNIIRGTLGPEKTILVEAGSPSSLYALDHDGEIRWTFKAGKDLRCLGVSREGMIYVGSSDNEVFTLDPNGSPGPMFKTISNRPLGGIIAEDGTIYVGTIDNYLYAMNPDGSVKWKYSVGNYLFGIAVDNYGIYLSSVPSLRFENSFLSALNLDGTFRWIHSISGTRGSTPVIGEGTLYYTSESTLYAFDPDGTPKWTRTVEENLGFPAIDWDGTIYVNGHTKLYAIAPDNKLKWVYTAEKFTGLPTIDNEGSLFFAAGSRLYSLNSDGTLRWVFRFDTPKLSIGRPIIGEEKSLYLICTDGVYAFGSTLTEEPTPEPWYQNPMIIASLMAVALVLVACLITARRR